MNHKNPQITLREAEGQRDTETFWAQLHAYHKRDIFPDPEHEDLEYFLGAEYRAQIQAIHDRTENRCRYLFFCRDGSDIGFAMPVIANTEDGKCFILEFCVYPEYRGNGAGKQCAKALLDWAKEHGAAYAELNCGNNDRRLRFWQGVGFLCNGTDEWGEPLMLLPPEQELPYHVEILTDAKDWQLLKLENGFLTEIGEAVMTEEKQAQLQQAVQDGKITFFMAKRGYRAVGMCSVVKCYSTFSCADIGVFDDFYVEPVFRKRGIARMLAKAAQSWSKEHGLASLTVCCAPCDGGMYQAIGFDTPLGRTYVKINESSNETGDGHHVESSGL